jgi:predicted nucleotidyltransferase
MGKTALDLSPEERRSFHPADTIRQRNIERREEIEARRDQAWQLARRAAELLKNEFGAARVVVFGSLAHEDWFTPWSDVDLAAWGIPPSRYFEAVAALSDLDSEMKIDLVDPESCRPKLRDTIEREGVERLYLQV